MKIRKLQPDGKRECKCLIQGSWIYTEEDNYPISDAAKVLRQARVHDGVYMNIRQAARLLGLKPSELSDLEHGRAWFVDEADFYAATKLLASEGDR
jgi:hypothetical protein